MKTVQGFEADSLELLQDMINHQVSVWDKTIEDVQYQPYVHPNGNVVYTALVTFYRRKY